MNWNERPWRRISAAICGVVVIALTLLIAARPADFEKLFLRTAGGVIQGVSDHLSVWVSGAIIMAAASWIALVAVGLWQRNST